MTSTESTAAAGLTDVLSAILNRHGATIVEDRRRLLGLLRDKAPVEMRPIRILMVAFDQGVPGRLKHAPISEIDIGREVAHLTSEAGISSDLARAAVLSWASALAGYKPATAAETNPLPLPAAVAPLPPVQPLSVQPLPATVSPPVQPLPQAAPSVQPIPATPGAMVQPLPVQPLPATVPPSVQPLLQAAPSVQPFPQRLGQWFNRSRCNLCRQPYLHPYSRCLKQRPPFNPFPQRLGQSNRSRCSRCR